MREADMKRLLIAVGVVALGVGAVARAAAPEKGQAWNASELKFTAVAKGIERAVVWGNPDQGDYGTILRFQPGAERGWHSHSNPIHLVVIFGTVVWQAEGGPPQELGPGAGVNEAAKVKHDTKCKEGAQCLFLITGAKKYDFKAASAKTAEK
jgi:quercetin dioxygenase-like cupin family protein